MNEMTSAVVTHAVLPISLQLPAMSRALADLVHAVRFGRTPKVCDPAPRHEAALLLTAYETACRPVPAPVLFAWLETINLGASTPVGQSEFKVRAAAIAELLRAMPVGAFTRESQAEAGSEMKFFPGAAEIKTALSRRTSALWGVKHALQKLASLPEPEPPSPPVDPEVVRVMFKKCLMAISAVSQPAAGTQLFQGIDT